DKAARLGTAPYEFEPDPLHGVDGRSGKVIIEGKGLQRVGRGTCQNQHDDEATTHDDSHDLPSLSGNIPILPSSWAARSGGSCAKVPESPARKQGNTGVSVRSLPDVRRPACTGNGSAPGGGPPTLLGQQLELILRALPDVSAGVTRGE